MLSGLRLVLDEALKCSLSQGCSAFAAVCVCDAQEGSQDALGAIISRALGAMLSGRDIWLCRSVGI